MEKQENIVKKIDQLLLSLSIKNLVIEELRSNRVTLLGIIKHLEDQCNIKDTEISRLKLLK